MDTLPLPPRPDLAQYRTRAKELVKVAASADEDAIRRWAEEWLAALARLRDVPVTPFVRESLDRAVEEIERRARSAGDAFTLADAQHAIARAHGFARWSEFAQQVERLAQADSVRDPFESGADAVVTGDLATLESLLGEHPELVRARSAREHRATLLHYVAANGVEDFRQLTPPNAVAIASALLEVGAEVDAVANTYGGGLAQTTMNLLVSSAHPAEAGVQPALVETLLDHGAAIDGLEDDGSPLMTALAFGYGVAAETLARRGARVDNVLSAAALGRVDLVERMLAGGGTVAPSLVGLYWLELEPDPESHRERALVWACAFGRTGVVELLLANGLDPGATDQHDMTGLHWAAARRHLDVVRLLVERGAPLEVRNRWGGTVLDSTLYFALQPGVEAESYLPVLELLLASGADPKAATYPTGRAPIDELLERHGVSKETPAAEVAPFEVGGMAPLIQVYDMPEAIRFYCDGLGFELVQSSEEIEAPEGRYFHWAWLRLGGANLMLNTAYDAGERPPERDLSRESAHRDTELYFDCPDVDGAYADLRAKGLDVEEPKTAPYGMRQLRLRDPDGYVLCFQSPA
jgi:ankyrin repeat protein/uncharacterized glyoxalase superfamily protein PhnB